MTEHSTESPGWSELLDHFGGEAALAASAFEHKALRRKRGVASAGDLLRLALMYGPGGHSLRMAAALAETASIANLSDVALMKRLAGSADWLQALCGERLSLVAGALKDDGQPSLRIRDATTVSGPGQGRRYMLHMSYAPGAGRIADFSLAAAPCGESMMRLPAGPGELLIADRAYPQAPAMAALRAQGAELLLRLTWKSLRLTGEDGRLLDWRGLLRKAQTQTLDMPVHVVRARSRFAPLPMRLVLLPKPAKAAAQSRERARRAGIKEQSRFPDPRTRAAAGCLILLTSLTQEKASPERLRELYAVRWQIELAFKRMKSILDIGKLPAKQPDLARAWLYAHLLIALLSDNIRSAADAIPP